MNKYVVARMLFSIVIVLAMILTVPVCLLADASSGAEVRKGAYSIHRAPVPEAFVAGIDHTEMIKAHLGEMKKIDEGLKGHEGRYVTLFQEKDKKEVRITVAVYGSTEEAEDSALEVLNDTSALLQPGSKSGGTIGTHSWYLVSPNGSGSIVFTYNNALLQVFSSNYQLAERSAQAIAVDLSRGSNGVKLAAQVLLPKVVRVDIPLRVEKKKEVALTLSGLDPYNQKLSFVVMSSKGQVLSEQTPGKKLYIPTESGSDNLRIYAIDELNVVSEVYVKEIEVEKGK